jgi:uncharacterized protein YkwD
LSRVPSRGSNTEDPIVLSTRPTLRLPLAALALAIALALLLPVTAFAWGTNAFSSSSEQDLFQLTNQARAAAGRKALHWDNRLAALARARAKDMIVRNYFAHQIPPDGHTVFDVMSNVGYCFNLAGENIGWNNYPDDQATGEIQTMFMNSPDHKQNILGPAWDVVGIGAYKGPDGKKMWAVVFADKCGSVAPAPKPKPAKPKPPVKPAPTKPRQAPAPGPSATPLASAAPVPTPSLRLPPSAAPGSTPVASGEVAVAAGSSLRVTDPAASQGLLESIAAGIAGLFFGN